jgi:hypothetical protein
MLFIFGSLVFAQAIYGTKDSFYKSTFCKKYQCELISSVFSKNEGLNGGVWYINYKIKEPGAEAKIDIFTHRDKYGVMISSAGVYFPDDNVTEIEEFRIQMLSDFVFVITGKRIKPTNFTYDCSDGLSMTGKNYKIMYRGKTVVKSPSKSVSYVLYCELLGFKDPKTHLGESFNFVISDDYHPR